jgi:hypothetical protein
MRPALADALLAGCIPVFFASCLDDRLAYETMCARYHARGESDPPPLHREAQFAQLVAAASGKREGFG